MTLMSMRARQLGRAPFSPTASPSMTNPRISSGPVMTGDGRPFAAVQRADSDDGALRAVPRGVPGRVVIPAGRYRLTERTTAFTVHAPNPGSSSWQRLICRAMPGLKSMGSGRE